VPEVTAKPQLGYSRCEGMSAQRERVRLSRSEEVRSSNDRIARRAVRLRFVSRVPMLCECSDQRCQAIVLVGLERYDELRETGFFTAPDHEVDDAEPALREESYWVQRPVGDRAHRDSR
jgi:hypothetical protein